MLTRLKVSGFKNLVDVDVRFGPFTCIAGANGTGKSNLFDAIRFLSLLTDHSLNDAARKIRNTGTGSIRDLFTKIGTEYVDTMSFEVEMITPTFVQDGDRRINFVNTHYQYYLSLGYRRDNQARSRGGLYVAKEALEKLDGTKPPFAKDKNEWSKSALHGETGMIYIMNNDADERELGYTLLSRITSFQLGGYDNDTWYSARHEIHSWRVLHLNPNAIRQPDRFDTPAILGDDGSHLPALVDYLARTNFNESIDEIDEEQVMVKLSNRLSTLVEGFGSLRLDRNTTNEILTLYFSHLNGTAYPIEALSDGTLRFLALAALELDEKSQNLYCIEEPENGIDPSRIPALLNLLQRMCVDTRYAVDGDNPLRQVIISTHSPAIVQQVPEDSLLIAQSIGYVHDKERSRRLLLRGLPNTWRTQGIDWHYTVSSGELAHYLNPVLLSPDEDSPYYPESPRVIDRKDMRDLLDVIFGARSIAEVYRSEEHS